MSRSVLERPRFTRAYIDSIGKSFDERGFRALFPAWLIACFVVGGSISYFMPPAFWGHESQPVSVVVYTGILTINGLMLALSWSAFSRIHESISGDRFGAYLMEKNLIGDYIVYIGYVHAAQVISVIASAAGLIILLYDTRVIFDMIAFAVVLALSIYAMKQAANSVTIMHDLIWQKAIFDRNPPQGQDGKVFHIRKD